MTPPPVRAIFTPATFNHIEGNIMLGHWIDRPRTVTGSRASASAILAVLAVASLGASARGADEKEMSPPTIVDAMDFASDFNKIEQQFEAILAYFNDEKLFNTRAPEVSAWSIGQQATHCMLANTGIADAIDKMLADPKMNADQKPNPMAFNVLRGGVIPRGVSQASEAIRPSDAPDRLKARADWLAARDRWRQFSKKQTAIESSPSRSPHFAFGQLTSRQWSRFVAIHNAHHLKIIVDIETAVGTKQ